MALDENQSTQPNEKIDRTGNQRLATNAWVIDRISIALVNWPMLETGHYLMKLDIIIIAFTAYYHLKKVLLFHSDQEVITFFLL
jgi:hypothetical protein